MNDEELRSLTKYPKIYTIFDRDKNFKVIEGTRNPILDGIENVKDFIVTEKIDGTNCGIILTPEKEILIRKRSNIVKDDKEHHVYFEAVKDIDMEKVKEYFSDSESLVTIFGEACGGNIQKEAKTYSETPTFKLFDIKCGNSFFDWKTLLDFSKFTGIPLVRWEKLKRVPSSSSNFPFSYTYWLNRLTEENKKKYIEGYVVRSDPPLLNKFGTRMMFKIKLRDYKK